MTNKKIRNYLLAIPITLLVLYLLMPFHLSLRTSLDPSSVTRVFMTRAYRDPDTGHWASDQVELGDTEDIEDLIALLQGTPSLISTKTITDYNGFHHDGQTDSYNILLVNDATKEVKNILLSNNYLKVKGKINLTYRVFHNLEGYQGYFTL